MNILNQFKSMWTKINKNNVLSTVRKCTTISVYDPPYLEAMKSKIPLYDTLNIQLRGYDYPVLENYQKFIHNMLKNIDISVEDSWATPAQHFQILRYKPKSSVLDSEFKMQWYERNIQITDVLSTQYAVLLRLLEASLPEGVTLNIHEHNDYDEEIRYVPDKELLQLKTQLEDMSSTKKK